MSDTPNFNNWSCPIELRDYPNIVMGHGGGGKLSSELVEHLFLPAFASTALNDLRDSTVLPRPSGRIAVTTDSFVVRPLFFPGSSIGELAVNGTVNDLAMSGATPLYLTVGFILEEGLPLTTLAQIVDRLAAAARRANVQLVAGDTKVVERGKADGIYINTAGIGVLPGHIDLSPSKIQPGDHVLVSGTLGDHGMAVMSVREGLEFETALLSDCQPLNGLVASMLAVSPHIRMLRDPTRGGLSASLNEIAAAANLGIRLEEKAIPVRTEVRAACEFLGLDPLYVANEGKLVAIVPATDSEEILKAMRALPEGQDATRIGEVTADHPRKLYVRTQMGTSRVIPLPLGEQLPRIC